MSDSREAFEKWWASEMNIEEMPLFRTEFPMTGFQDQAYICHETNRAWMAWQASRQEVECAND